MYYEIQGTSVRLAGSLHLVPATVPNLPDWIWLAYEWGEDIILEADLATMKQHIYLGEGDSLERELPSPLWNALKGAWPANHPLGPVESLKPWMVILTLPMTGVPTAPGVEGQLSLRARQDKKSIAYLETMAGFAELGDSIPCAAIQQALSIILGQLPNAPQRFLDLYQSWTSGRIEAVEAVAARTPLHKMPEIASRVIDLRNERWLPKVLAATTSRRRTLIAVGALHLPGENGLLARLRRAGNDVRLIS